MSIIVAHRTETYGFMLADSAASDGHNVFVDSVEKIVVIGDIIVGVAGNAQLITALNHMEKEDTLFTSVTDFLLGFKNRCDMWGMVKTSDGAAYLPGGTQLILFGPTISGPYIIHSDFSITQSGNTVAIGSGDDFFYGYLACKVEDDEPPTLADIKEAMHSACKELTFCEIPIKGWRFGFTSRKIERARYV